jgi:hypothetical protein
MTPTIMRVPSMIRTARYPTAAFSSSFHSKGYMNTAMNTMPMLLIDQSRAPQATAAVLGDIPAR